MFAPAELLRNQLRRFLLADAVVVRHVAGLTQVKPGNQQILQGVLVEIAEQIQLRRFPGRRSSRVKSGQCARKTCGAHASPLGSKYTTASRNRVRSE